MNKTYWRRPLRVVFAIATALLLFFGIGPVLIADGSAGKRLLTLIVVLLLLAVLSWVWIRVERLLRRR